MSANSGVPGKTVLQLARSLGAANRQAQRATRSAEEQLFQLRQRPGSSLRERRRLLTHSSPAPSPDPAAGEAAHAHRIQRCSPAGRVGQPKEGA